MIEEQEQEEQQQEHGMARFYMWIKKMGAPFIIFGFLKNKKFRGKQLKTLLWYTFPPPGVVVVASQWPLSIKPVHQNEYLDTSTCSPSLLVGELN